MRKIFLPILALFGALFALYVVFLTQKKNPVAPILFPPPKPPYVGWIAGSGIIEASSRNISIGSPFNEIVTEVYVKEGDFVKKGQPLFQLDLRERNAQAEAARASLAQAIAQMENAKIQFSFYQKLTDKCAVSIQTYEQYEYSYKIAEEAVKVSQANLSVIEANIERSTIRAPFDSLVLQVNIHLFEIAPTVPFVSSQATLILLGRVDPLTLRIDIDENDAWRYKKGAQAQAFVRGNSHINFPLVFNQIEPYILPKTSFTGQTNERVDTRVLQVLYDFEWNNLPIYPGQILDVYIEADPLFKETP